MSERGITISGMMENMTSISITTELHCAFQRYTQYIILGAYFM